jgi:hypothetical protein
VVKIRNWIVVSAFDSTADASLMNTQESAGA